MNTNYSIQSKSTYASEANASKIGKAVHKENYIGTHQLPSGRFCYVFVPAANAHLHSN